jgi:hypothetical protein
MVHKSTMLLSGGGGSGTVTEIDTGTGLTGGPITTTGTIAMATGTIDTLAGYDHTGVFSGVTVSTGLSLSSGVLTATGGGTGTVTSVTFTGDGTVLSSTPSGAVTTSGTLTAALANAGAYSLLGNSTSGSAAPSYVTSPVVSGSSTADHFVSTVSTGTAPLTVTSTTAVTNLSIGGNAGTATALATARAIGGVNFDGTAAITPQQIQPASESSDTTTFPLFVNAASGTAQQPKYNASFGYNASTNALTATTFVGALSGNASTVTTNANLTGVITSSGNATTIASQTGTGTKFVVDTSPTLVTPTLGVATATSINTVTIAGASTPALTVTGTAGVSGSNTGDQTITLTSDVTGSGTGSFATTIRSGVALAGSPTTTTQSQGTSNTTISTTAYVDTAVANAIAGVNPASAVQVASADILPNSPAYNNGASGIGATITDGGIGVTSHALVVDGYTVLLADRVLVKNESGGGGLGAAKNGVYFLSVLGVAGVTPWVLTRALDYDTPSDINNTGAIPVINGTVNTLTQWVLTSKVTTVGTDSLTYTEFSVNPTTLLSNVLTSANIFVGSAGNVATGQAVTGDITLTNGGVSAVVKIAGVSVGTPSGTTNVAFTNSPTFVTPTLGAASATSLATSAASPLLLTNGQLVTVALTSQTVGGATLTIPNFASVADTFTFNTLAQTLSNKTFVAPALGTPASGVATNLTGTAAGLTAGHLSNNIKSIGFTAITPVTGKQAGYITFPVAGTISAWSISVDTGTATITTWKVAAGTAVPTVSNSISTAGVAISSGTSVRSTTVTDFTSTTVTAADIFAFNISAVSGATQITFLLEITVT